MAEPLAPPVLRYTGTETCAKCGAPATAITAGYDGQQNWVMLQCQKCTNRWYVLPLDSPPP